jgi:acyl-CoA synthetase (AMP-forming)/AMP-acid ligase II
MFGGMQNRPLLISSLIEYAAQYHGEREIVSRTVEGPIHRYDWASAAVRSRKVAQALSKLGVQPGERIATLAWNGFRHLELYYGISGMGAVVHTINPRLFPEQIIYIANHAEDSYLFTDLTFVPLLEKIAGQLKSVKGFVIMTDAAHMPKTSLPNVLCYETLLEGHDGSFAWPVLDERSASALCYTSGTTGNPKGVLYDHRSTILHAMSACMRDTLGLWSGDSILPVVPMFHVNAWGIPYAAAMCGAKLVFPGAALDGPHVCELIESERVTISAGVPTVWLMMLNHLKETGKTLPYMERTVIGGSACSRAMMEAFENTYDVRVIHAWGMTETSPIGTLGTLKPAQQGKPLSETIGYKLKQGRGVYGVDLKLEDDDGKLLPRDGKAFGHLKVRGPWVVSQYFKGEGGQILDADGYFDTGDVATIDPEGFMQITDRAKDVIKSGGEWISSIEIENIASGHPAVAEAAVIGMPHPKWDERPLLVVIRRPGAEVTREELLTFLTGKIAKWWMPDDVVFVTEIPHTATGKISKRLLRDKFGDYKWPGA